MNADILKPYLDVAVADFPGQSITLSLNLTSDSCGVGSNGFQANAVIGDAYYWGNSIPECTEKAKLDYTPEKSARKLAAQKLRTQADRIANGIDPIPTESTAIVAGKV